MITREDSGAAIQPRVLQHVCYVVPDIPAAAERWASTVGAGPFFWLGRHIEFDEAVHRGEPGVLDFSAAIGRWGPVFVELADVHEASPSSLERSFVGAATDGNHVAHISYAVDDLAAEQIRLESQGCSRFLHARRGPIEVSFYDAPFLGHAIEVQEDTEFFNDLFGLIGQAAEDWDGDQPLRELPTG